MKDDSLFPGAQKIQVRALLIAERADLRRLERVDCLAKNPLTIRAGQQGVAILFRYGAAVLFNVLLEDEPAFVESLANWTVNPHKEWLAEETAIVIAAADDEGIRPDGNIQLRQAKVGQLQAIADVLSKSVALDFYERQVHQAFEYVQPIAEGLRTGAGAGIREWPPVPGLLHQIGEVLMVQHRMVGRIEITERPDLLWNMPDLDRLHERLVSWYELHERDRALSRKLNLIEQTAETSLKLIQARRSLRVEWYIVILIVIEIFLTLYDLFLLRN